jgi:hypothetical protein
MEREIGLAVLEVIFQPAAQAKAMVGRDRDVAAVEEAVDVWAKEQPVVETSIRNPGKDCT